MWFPKDVTLTSKQTELEVTQLSQNVAFWSMAHCLPLDARQSVPYLQAQGECKTVI